MKDQGEGEPQGAADRGQDKPPASIHYLDEWRARHPRWYSSKAEGRAGRSRRGVGQRRGQGQSGSGRRGYPGRYFNEYPRSSTYGRRTPRPVSSIHGGATPFRTRTRPYVIWFTVVGIIALLIIVTRSLPTNQDGPLVDPPTTLRIWFADARGQDDELVQLLNTFSETYGVEVQWRSSGADPHEIIHTLLVGPAPDVVFIDGDMGERLLAVDALLELFEHGDGPGAEASRDHYLLQLAQESMWVRSLRAAVPRLAPNPDLARRFISYLADIVAGSAG